MTATNIQVTRKEYYEKNKEHIKAKSRKYYLANKEKVKNRQKKYEEDNPELIKDQRSKSSKKHRDARNKQAREYNADHRDVQQERSQRCYYKNLKRQMVSNAKHRAKRKQLPFDLIADDIEIPTHCPVLGMELIWGEGLRDESPSLDRIIPRLGYVKSNVAVISNIANKLKNNATLEQLEQICSYMRDQEISPKNA